MKPESHARLFSRLGNVALAIGAGGIVAYIAMHLKADLNPLWMILMLAVPLALVGIAGRLVRVACEKCGRPMRRVGYRTYAWRCPACGQYVDTKVRTGMRHGRWKRP